MECQFCKNILKTISSLNYHIKNNKKCLEIQSKNKLDINSSLIVCKYCEKKFSLTNINKHIISCKIKKKIENEKIIDNYINIQNKNKEIEKYNQELINKTQDLNNQIQNLNNQIQKLIYDNKNIQELKDYIIKLETENSIYKKDHETISDIAKQPKTLTNTNNIINNLSTYDHDEIKNRFCVALSNIKPSDLYDGQKSIGRFVAPCLKNEDGTKMLSCTDHTRNVFVYKDKNGNVNKDIKCKNLVDLIEPIASAKADELIKEDYDIKMKSFRLTTLYNQINKRIEEIKYFKNHLLGLENNSKKWKYIKELIKQKEDENIKDKNEIEDLENKGIIENNTYDDKLIVAVDDIKDMQKDSTKFSKVLSELV